MICPQIIFQPIILIPLAWFLLSLASCLRLNYNETHTKRERERSPTFRKMDQFLQTLGSRPYNLEGILLTAFGRLIDEQLHYRLRLLSHLWRLEATHWCPSRWRMIAVHSFTTALLSPSRNVQRVGNSSCNIPAGAHFKSIKGCKSSLLCLLSSGEKLEVQKGEKHHFSSPCSHSVLWIWSHVYPQQILPNPRPHLTNGPWLVFPWTNATRVLVACKQGVLLLQLVIYGDKKKTHDVMGRKGRRNKWGWISESQSIRMMELSSMIHMTSLSAHKTSCFFFRLVYVLHCFLGIVK